MTHYLEISVRDPLIARDGRPFGAAMGQRMKSLDWFYPSVAAGMVRTLLGEKNGGDFSPDAVKVLKRVEVAGALPMSGSNLFFPVPQDIAIQGRGEGEKSKTRVAGLAGLTNSMKAREQIYRRIFCQWYLHRRSQTSNLPRFPRFGLLAK